MGGKHKQAQRTKNNARPSSSGRSAEFLGSSIPQFVGFSAVKETGIVMPSFSAFNADDFDSSVDSNFQLVFKKMNKKDSTTKLKALQEFAELVKAAEVEAIKAILPFWPRLYCALATDTEHKVREASHIAHHQVVLKAKRNLAPYLKQLVGPWFTSQYDTYAPAATAATKAFQDAFPQNKLYEAIVFCQEEILSYICDNLTVHTAQTLSNPKTISPEDSEAKYQRVLISSLLGYALYLKVISNDELEKSIELNLKIVSNAKFWKLIKNKIDPIKSAWFQVISALCQKSESLREREAAHIVGSVFGNLDENEPTVLPAIWEAALSILSTISDWWKYVNLEKLVLPKLWKVLKEGGQGNATVIFPNMLPMISHLPQVIDLNAVYCSFFENIRTGLKSKTVIGSRSESQAVSIAFVECLQYVILKNQQDVVLCEKLIKAQLFPVLEWSLINTQAPYKAIFNQVSTLIQYWNRNQNNVEFPNYSKYCDYFWNNLGSLFEGLLLNLEHSYESNALSQLASRQIEFLLSLKHNCKPKKHMKVTFSNTDLQELSGEILSNNENVATDFDKNYLDALNALVCKTCECYVKFINEKRKKELIEHLVCLVQDFDSRQFFQHLNLQFGKGEASNFIEIYRQLLVKWLNSQVLCSKAVIDLIFLLFKYLDTNGKEEVLNSFTNISKEECFGWCISQCLSHPHNEDAVVDIWLHNDHIRQFLLDIVKKELRDECTPELSLILKQAFAEKPNGELFINESAVMDIINTLKKPLLEPSAYELVVDSCASFAAYISAIVYTPNFKLLYGDELLLSLFTLSCSFNNDNEFLSKDTLWEASTAWQDAISILSQELAFDDFRKLIVKCADIVEKEVLVNNQNSDMNHIVDVIINFISCLQNSNPLRIYDVLVIFLKRNFIPSSQKSLITICKRAEFVHGNLCSPYQSFEENDDVNPDENYIQEYFVWMTLTAQVLTKPIMSGRNEDDEDLDSISETEKLSVLKMVVVADDVLNLILDLLYSLAIADSFQRNYHCTKFCKNVISSKQFITEKIKLMTETLEEDFIIQIKSALTERAIATGWLWSNSLHTFFSDIVPQNLGTIYSDVLNQLDADNSKLPMLHLTQTFAANITYDQVLKKCSPIENIIMLRSVIKCDELDVQIAEAFAKIDRIQQENKAQFMYTSIGEGITWEQMELIVETIRLYSEILKYKPECIQFNRWDLIIISFATWSKNIAKCKHKYQELQIESFIVALSNLFISIYQYLQQCGKENIISEWNDVFAQDIHKDFIEIWLYICEKYEDHSCKIPLSDLPFLQDFGKLINHFDYTYIFNKKHQNLPKWSKLLKHCCSLLTHPVNCLQLWGYNMLMVLLPGLVEVDSVSVNTNKPHEKGLIFEQFKDILCHTQEIVQSMLIEFKLGEDSCKVKPFTDSYTYTFAYLLIWDILLSLCEKSSTELHYQYADWLKNADLLNNLLDNIFKLIPAEIMHQLEGKSKRYTEWFTTKFSVSFTDMCTSECIEQMVCWIYSSTLAQLPALVRQWWSNKETRTAQIVERVTAMFVSPQLCSQELTDVAQHETKFKNMVVKVHPSVREVVAIYTVDEAQMELIITLPNNYPLVGPDVQCNRQICGTSHRQWLMQLKMCVLHQNGRIWDGLSLWNNNLDKKFDGVEECYICFAVLHQGTYQLPKLSCQTCRKKFHSACLYKWFSMSNKSTCPICRNLF